LEGGRKTRWNGRMKMTWDGETGTKGGRGEAWMDAEDEESKRC